VSEDRVQAKSVVIRRSLKYGIFKEGSELMLLSLAAAFTTLVLAVPPGQEQVSFPTADGGVVYADVYGEGARAVVLAHGARFDKESWATQAQALAEAGYRVVAIDFRGRGQSRGGPEARSPDDGVYFDVLAAVRYLHESGAKTVSVVGASFGGWAPAQAAVVSPGQIDRIVLLATTVDEPELLEGAKLFIVTRDDSRGGGVRRLPEIRDQYERAREPKELVILEGSAHAQFVFETEQGESLMREIMRFLSQP
jgi:pimeloyl-ACP methyl ester carboxylesterase